MIKYVKTCPLFLLLLFSGLLFTIAGFGGRSSIYKEQSYDPVKEPVMAVMFRGMGEEIYPWQLFQNQVAESVNLSESEDGTELDEDIPEKEEPSLPVETSTPSATQAPVKTALPTSAPVPTPVSFQKLEPLRETTHQEYLNHISADIYGDAGVKRAAEYAFVPIDPEWFSDALFIGDSRTVGLRDYTDLSEYADFYCETSLTIYKVLEKEFSGKGTVADALAKKDYGKIYLMVGINELGRGTTEDFMAKYTEVIETLHELAPEALIYIQGIMRVSGTKNREDAIFNNDNINARNNAIATLADNQQIFYIDINEVVCDEEGNLNEEYTHDQIHLLGMYNELWKEFLLTKGVVLDRTDAR